MATINVNDDSFENEVLKSDVPVVVDFWLSGVVHASRLVHFGRTLRNTRENLGWQKLM